MTRSRIFTTALALVTLMGLGACGAERKDGADEERESESESDGAADTDTDTDTDGQPPCEVGALQPCSVNGQDTGWQRCVEVDGEGVWDVCVPDGDESTPLVLVFGGEAVRYHADARPFDLDGRASTLTDWPTATTPWLVLDRDGDGRISDGAELFGSMTPLAAGGRAVHGFEALAELDDNGDGRIDGGDAAWSALQLWADDGDRASTAAELSSLAALGVEAISLRYHIDPRCDARGNCEVERASFIYHDRAGHPRVGEVVDVHLQHR